MLPFILDFALVEGAVMHATSPIWLQQSPRQKLYVVLK
jgi:hypothetical protein